MKTKRHIILMSTLLSLIAASRLLAADDHDHGHEHEHAEGHAHAVTIEVPETPEALWARVNHLAAGLSAHVTASNFAALASDAANLDALLGELAHAIGKMPADAQQRAKGMQANAARATDTLIHAAEDADAAASEKAVKQLGGVLMLLKSSFPKEVTAGNEAPTWTGGPHGGHLAPLQDATGETVAWAELKLHDDKGDLELWIAADPRITKPHDFASDTTATVSFPKLDKTVTLKVRNAQANEDEDGKPNMRDGKTNYFIFPGDTGADVTWLKGADFSSDTVISIGDLKSPVFKLVPHIHGVGHEH